MAVKCRRDGAAGIVELDNPPVNAMGLALRQGLMAAVDWAENQPGLDRVIVTGMGRVFAAGGDAREFDAPPVAPHLPDVLNRIESCSVPWIAAAHGAALGGGLELMLACRYRIAAPGTQLGLPEVTLGVVPGAGGTQRLPRLVGTARAAELISTGKALTAEAALADGIIDAVAEDPLAEAMMVVGEALDTLPIVSTLPAPEPDADAIAAARAAADKKQRAQIAPQRALDLIEISASVPFDEALEQERETFITLRNGTQARALRHIFFAERGAKAPDWLTAAP
ncbi:enoyl-CoA hydratase/isomerase family protein, partial [Actibacterium sp.]|uniref:enoyl-CoA hydratase/isomerase family protein n=1 Tax=Actibacterium sp. TaxID=1872125 RepID=UPI003564359A